jgi:galactokinase
MGSGVSSSAAIELAFGVLWNVMAQLGLDNKTLAVLAQKCENQFVGVNCGIMDQMASAMGRDGAAMFLDTRSLAIMYAQIPEDLSIVICDTKKPRALTDSAYNERRRQCEEAAHSLGVPQLRDAAIGDLENHKANLSEIVYRRARHVVTENDRCLMFRAALGASDRGQVSALMRASHESLRDDYEVSCPELDAMAQSCWTAPGCVGARMTGAGFGGVCVALVESSSLGSFTGAVEDGYSARTGLSGQLIPCRAVRGAHIIGV